MSPEKYLLDWQTSQTNAESISPLLGQLYRQKGVEVLLFGRPLINASTIDIVKAHRLARRYVGDDLSPAQTLPVLKQLNEMSLSPCRVDIGQLAHGYWQNNEDESNLNDYLATALVQPLNGEPMTEPRDVVLYGFGRIGRLLTRLLVEKSGPGYPLRLRAIVVRGGKKGDLEKRASLLRRDSVHGQFNGSIIIDEERKALIANGNYIQFIYANSPEEVDYTQYGIQNALVVDNTGVWRDAEGLGQHVACAGASKVLLTAPGKGDIKNIVFGVNESMIQPEDNIVSAASCTTNAITPVLKAINDKYGVDSGHIETVHSYTNDQNLIDNFHKGERRGRSASLNMVLTSTGAASAVAKALPELAGKLSGNSIRVPTPNVSMAVANLNLNADVSKEELNQYLREMALNSPLAGQIDYTESTEVVSTDIVGSRHPSVVDGAATIAQDNRCVLYIWYDNEFGYSCQVVHCMEQMMGVRYKTYPVVS
ncbi:putative glyceraldehyde-3-phosphate dehydrogenase [Vibrio nigripulchritudo SFn27]|uniref:Glyceraldehyde-3-phosphate dehydrogenase n=1 Tax=Vibrio nigripulchritudo TaxID=28173 RepID=U4K4P8_9VIBR|nr:glyceraldehyde-3-phosphate dehydrogenase [Vibrio nigripulchritudo]CCN85247.1 putative glyceraldehyde-3-phosphate dehydrogenase [Vibrio nigripulchritudo BLFn1]CCN87603.1 putative glyceraldehyde-3-phosphate dehydrogenase [Vibrio nigripulchritudo SFn27]CCN92484.1 putative glyceraldehyde-3-phosphate dehydrogenase [Vibrio nigripulchritudo ENn2]CCO39347.1 putative glyceraldehyde-3-phosphate dehydrogenase [Vibrio nigripulchritudo SFn135]CCO53425.1 putative glyceraldehyde-3-phosphate dehydrogenase 